MMLKRLLPIALMVLAVSSGAPARAEDSEAEPMGPKAQELRRLKEENPEQFRKLMQQKRAHVRERLQKLKETDPEAYRKAVARMKEERKKRLEWLKEHKPEQYQRIQAERRERLEQKKGRHDWDNNPPGPRGGRGTNWENIPGPRGGPGAGPDRRKPRPTPRGDGSR